MFKYHSLKEIYNKLYCEHTTFKVTYELCIMIVLSGEVGFSIRKYVHKLTRFANTNGSIDFDSETQNISLSEHFN